MPLGGYRGADGYG